MRDDGDSLGRIQAAIAASGDLAYDWNLADDTLAWFGHVEDVFGEPVASGDELKARIVGDDADARMRALADHLSARDPLDCEYRVRGPGGRIVWLHERGAAQFVEGHPVRLVGTVRVVTARKQREAELEYLANYDPLTGHFNRTRLKGALEHALAGSARYGAPGAYLVVGVDAMGSINDAYGSETGDAVILGVGQQLDRCLRQTDVVGRLGGDRFGIVLSQCPPDHIALAAEKIVNAIREAPLDTPHGPVHVTVSVGAVSFAGSGLNAHEVMSRGDSALQSSKLAGRNCFMPFSESSEHRELRRRALAISEEVQAALKSDRIVFAFQPVVAAGTAEVDHYECLLRLRRDDGSLLAAGAFVPIVEQTGLMRLVDRRALDLALRELQEHPGVHLAINISGLTASDRGWLRALVAQLRSRPDLAQRLIIEITETVALQEIDEIARFVATVRDLGCRVALDDFGAGYTSFRNLKALSVDCVKIDGSFVRGLADNIDNQLFVRTLLGLADGFGLATVAECVETAADAMHLTRRGVRFLQGYYFGRPTVERPWLQRPAPRLAVLQGGAAGD